MTTRLIALLSGGWDAFLKELEEEQAAEPKKQKQPFTVQAAKWDSVLSPLEDVEIAVFQPGLVGITDEYPNTYRRFVQVGNSPEEKLRNLFELGFEKGYQQIIFVEDSAIHISTELLNEVLEALSGADMVLGPTSEGAVWLWAMKKKHFWSWPYFSYPDMGSVVEILSLCNENEIAYKLLPVADRAANEAIFRKQVLG